MSGRADRPSRERADAERRKQTHERITQKHRARTRRARKLADKRRTVR